MLRSADSGSWGSCHSTKNSCAEVAAQALKPGTGWALEPNLQLTYAIVSPVA